MPAGVEQGGGLRSGVPQEDKSHTSLGEHRQSAIRRLGGGIHPQPRLCADENRLSLGCLTVWRGIHRRCEPALARPLSGGREASLTRHPNLGDYLVLWGRAFIIISSSFGGHGRIFWVEAGVCVPTLSWQHMYILVIMFPGPFATDIVFQN